MFVSLMGTRIHACTASTWTMVRLLRRLTSAARRSTLDINEMLEHVDKNTILVACMMVNNEIGTRNDVERLAAEVKHRLSLIHISRSGRETKSFLTQATPSRAAPR